jgi:pyruvate/2-oxoglutarate dehydrogenase complex dihydrolipoamide dehydrogenase (E3) component
MADEHYDAIVIGTSQGGRFLPVELAKAGQKVALVERDQLGGVCVNTGCTPTKTMVASARLAYQARRGAEYGVRIGPVSVDLAAVRERKRAMVAGARQNYASRLAQDGLDLIEGDAHFTGPKTGPGRCPLPNGADQLTGHLPARRDPVRWAAVRD